MSESQKFIARNRAPRVQIEYDVELNGAEVKKEIPFVMGVMADLSGEPKEELPDLESRKFKEFDAYNFDERMKAIQPRITTAVENVISEEGGKIEIDMTFESMDDFSPEGVARKVEPLRKLLEAREQLSNLLTYAGGKANREKLLQELLEKPELMRSMMAAPNPAADEGSGDGEENEG